MKLAQAEAKLKKAYKEHQAVAEAEKIKFQRMAELENKVADLGGDISKVWREAKK